MLLERSHPLLTCSPLKNSEIAQAFPLAQAEMPWLDPAAWRRMAEPLTRPRRGPGCGILTVRNEAGYICGLCLYRAEKLGSTRRLVANRFISFDLLSGTRVTAALLDALDALALKLGCGIVHSCLSEPQARLVESFRKAGHRPRLVMTCKTLRPCPAEGTADCGAPCLALGLAPEPPKQPAAASAGDEP
jgi:hypothetical protein